MSNSNHRKIGSAKGKTIYFNQNVCLSHDICLKQFFLGPAAPSVVGCYLLALLLFSYFLKYSIFQWHNLSKLEQAKYYEMAKHERQAHLSKELFIKYFSSILIYAYKSWMLTAWCDFLSIFWTPNESIQIGVQGIITQDVKRKRNQQTKIKMEVFEMGLSETFSPETNKSFRFLLVFIASCFSGDFIGLCFWGWVKKYSA